jgi:HEAT repeat protein
VTRRFVFAACLLILGCADRQAADLVERLKTRDAEELQQVTGKLVRLPNAIAVPALRQGLRAEKWRTRYMSCQLLGRFQALEAIPDLIVALRDSIGGVRAQAAGALGQLVAGQATQPLIALLDDDNEVVQIAAADALARIGSPEALPSLCRLSESRSLAVRVAAIKALGPCHDDTLAPLLSAQALNLTHQALDDVYIRVRIAAIVSLRALEYRGAVDDLLRLLRDPSPEVVHVAVQALGEITGVDHPAWQNHRSPEMALVTEALGSIVATTKNAAVRERARESLAKIAESGL